MTKRDRKALGEYVRWVADEMELRDWTIVLADAPTDVDGALAHVEAVDGRKLARIHFCTGFRDKDPEVQRHTVAHELVHCHLNSVQQSIECDLDGVLGRQADELFSANFRRHLELAVDGLAAALAKHLPLIDWP